MKGFSHELERFKYHHLLFAVDVQLFGVEAGGDGVETGRHSSTIVGGSPGVLHGTKTFVMQVRLLSLSLSLSLSLFTSLFVLSRTQHQNRRLSSYLNPCLAFDTFSSSHRTRMARSSRRTVSLPVWIIPRLDLNMLIWQTRDE